MRRFCLRHLFLIFAFCSLATSSYVLFDLLDIDGSNFKEHAQVCGFEAVMPACGCETKFAAVEHPAPWPKFSRGLLLNGPNMGSLALRPVLPSVFRHLILHTRKAAQQESASSPHGSDPARQSA